MKGEGQKGKKILALGRNRTNVAAKEKVLSSLRDHRQWHAIAGVCRTSLMVPQLAACCHCTTRTGVGTVGGLKKGPGSREKGWWDATPSQPEHEEIITNAKIGGDSKGKPRSERVLRGRWGGEAKKNVRTERAGERHDPWLRFSCPSLLEKV